jgi:hypothetical protein
MSGQVTLFSVQAGRIEARSRSTPLSLLCRFAVQPFVVARESLSAAFWVVGLLQIQPDQSWTARPWLAASEEPPKPVNNCADPRNHGVAE